MRRAVSLDLTVKITATAQMERKSHIDTFGAVALLSFAVVLAFNQVVIKVTTAGLARCLLPVCGR